VAARLGGVVASRGALGSLIAKSVIALVAAARASAA